MTIWGNHSATQYPDLFRAQVDGKNAAELIGDQAWIDGTFLPTVQQRGAAIIEARGPSSAASAANGWRHRPRPHVGVSGSPDGDWVSMAIPSDGSHDVPGRADVVLPGHHGRRRALHCVVTGLDIDDHLRRPRSTPRWPNSSRSATPSPSSASSDHCELGICASSTRRVSMPGSRLGGVSSMEWQLGLLTRSDNPVLDRRPAVEFRCPVLGESVAWAAKDVFNPGGVVRDGRVHLLVRAEDAPASTHGTSRIGLAISDDGVEFELEPEPVLFPADDPWQSREWPGGCEDPRVAESPGWRLRLPVHRLRRPEGHIMAATSDDLRAWKKHGLASAGTLPGRPVDQERRYRHRGSRRAPARAPHRRSLLDVLGRGHLLRGDVRRPDPLAAARVRRHRRSLRHPGRRWRARPVGRPSAVAGSRAKAGAVPPPRPRIRLAAGRTGPTRRAPR